MPVHAVRTPSGWPQGLALAQSPPVPSSQLLLSLPAVAATHLVERTYALCGSSTKTAGLA